MSGGRLAARAPLLAARRAVHSPDMLRVQLAWAAVMTASWTTTVGLTVVAYDAGGSAAVGLAVLVRAAVSALVGPAVGALVDRAPRARSLRWSAATCAAASAGAAAAGSALWPVVALTAVVAVAVVVFRTAQSAALPELVDDPADLTAANVLSSAVESLGLFAGPALAGLLLALEGPRLTFSVAGVLFAVACAALVRMQRSRTRRRTRAGQGTPASLRELLRLRPPRLLLLLVLAQTTVAGGVVVLSAALVVEVLGADVGAVGLVNSAFGLGCVVASLGLFALAGSSRLGAWTAVALLLWAAPLLLVPAAPGLTVVMVLLALAGAGNVLFDVTVVTLLQRAVPRHLIGRAFGALETVVVLGVTLGALVAPALERLRGPDWAFAALGAPLALVALAGLRGLLRLDRDLSAPTRQVALLRGLTPVRAPADPRAGGAGAGAAPAAAPGRRGRGAAGRAGHDLLRHRRGRARGDGRRPRRGGARPRRVLRRDRPAARRSADRDAHRPHPGRRVGARREPLRRDARCR